MPRRKLNGPLKLLSYLLDQSRPVTIMNIYDNTKMPYKTIYTAINVLKEAGFIEEEIDPGPPTRRLIRLTEKGREAAVHARKILELAGLL